MTPNKSGIWEWTDKKGIKRLVEVVEPLKGYFRAYWWGGYYNVIDSDYGKAEWVGGTWGNWVGYNDFTIDTELYDKPDPDEMKKIQDLNKHK